MMYVSNATKACALYEEERGKDGRIIGLRRTEEYATKRKRQQKRQKKTKK